MNKRKRSNASRRGNSRNRSARKRQRQEERRRNIIIFGIILLGVILVSLVARKIGSIRETASQVKAMDDSKVSFEGAPPLDVQLLTPNEYSRPGIAIKKIKNIVVHYTANPGSTAQSNRNYFEGLKDSHATKASSHFVIGMEGEVIQCIPSGEISYASNERNKDSLSIECCHKDETGAFTEATEKSLVELVGWLCKRFGLTSKDVIRHYDVTGKDCPRYYVQHEDAWEQFKQAVDAQIKILK